MKIKNRYLRAFVRERQFWLMLLPCLIWVGVFCYYPMYGVYMSFVRYIPGIPLFQSEFVGLQYFRDFFALTSSLQVVRNTLAISGLQLLFGFPAPILFALLLSEVRFKPVRRTLQTISYLPHFISWVVAASLAFAFFSTEGLINELFMRLGVRDTAVSYLGQGKYYWPIITGINIWKTIGWSSIIYLSSIAGIDSELYEAGEMDGLSRFGKVIYITLPCILPTIVFLFVFNISFILNAGFEQHLLIGNVQTREYWDVLDTYAYRFGIQMGRYSFAAAVSFMKGVVGIVLVFITNSFVRRAFKLSLF